MSARKEQINLLPEMGFETTTTGRILSWILSTFRIIVIVTEIIVMIAFLSRFWLDAQNTDLKEEIEQKQAVLTASVSFEKNFKDTQKRLEIFSELSKEEGKVTEVLSTATSYLPLSEDLFLSSFTVNSTGIIIEGTSPNEQSIHQYIVNLVSSDKFNEIGLVSLKSNAKDPSLIDFEITAKEVVEQSK
jgi:hypothetical protein